MNDCHPASKNNLWRNLPLLKEQPYLSNKYLIVRNPTVTLDRVMMFKFSCLMAVTKECQMKCQAVQDKTNWGKEQVDWFQQTYKASYVTFTILISPTPIMGPDRPQKRDNHSNSNFKYKGDLIRGFIQEEKNTFVV
jgi:hypothetical protein